MKSRNLITVIVLTAGFGLAHAADESKDHQAHHPGGTAGATATMAGGGMPMHENMKKMREQMAEIHRTTDPDKRDELIAAHMNNMRDMMKMMHGGKSMMGGPGRGMMGGPGGGMKKPGTGESGGNMMGGPGRGMMGGPDGGMKKPGMGESGGNMMGGPGRGMMDMMNRQQMMEQRMDMMQMMMDQMIESSAAAEDTRRIRERRHNHRKMK